MTQQNWYYADHERQNQGPLPASTIVALFRKGVLEADSLVWREGLPEWQALSMHFAEIGINPSEADRSLLLPLEPLPKAPAAAISSTETTPSGLPSNRDDTDVVPAGFVRRWAALLLDTLIISIPVSVLTFMFSIPFLLSGADVDSVVDNFLFLIYLVVAATYYAGMESSKYQATLGKLALGIKVVDLHGQRLRPQQALGRWFAASLSYLTLYIGFFMAAFTEKKRALHDFLANTQVVDRWAYTDHPENQKRELGGCLIALAITMAAVPLLGNF